MRLFETAEWYGYSTPEQGADVFAALSFDVALIRNRNRTVTHLFRFSSLSARLKI